ncbi:MAG: TetR/AcrR family transcriptional regulator [Nocardioides sp.]|nr:TetR/AcrR family transcriptional regulator [Nocardioides sp.]
MARPRLHALDDLLDVAEQLVTSGDTAGLTLRTLAARAGVSNGSIYHAFRSKEELLARLWLRASDRLGEIMTEALPEDTDGADGPTCVVAAALSPVSLARRHPISAQLFFAQRSDQLFSADVAPEVVEHLDKQQRQFTSLLIELAKAVWGRKDRAAVEAVAVCVVDIPGGLLRRTLMAGGTPDAAAETRIEAAVRAILALPLAPSTEKTRQDQ